jgi:hypothetical protein
MAVEDALLDAVHSNAEGSVPWAAYDAADRHAALGSCCLNAYHP